jgi:hypothetical protein
LSYAQQIYYVSHEPTSGPTHFYLGRFDVSTCKDTLLFRLFHSNPDIIRINDIAITPTGDIIVIYSCQFGGCPGGWSAMQYGRVNMATGEINRISTITTGASVVTGATCDAQNNLLLATNDLKYINLNTGLGHLYGTLDEPCAGDITFYQGDIIYCSQLLIHRVNLNQLSPLENLLPISSFGSTMNSPIIYGLVSVPYSCDSTFLFASLIDGLYGQGDPRYNNSDIYKIDLVSSTAQYLCSIPHSIWGMASATEYIASDCAIRLDLDDNNSSGLSGFDYQAQPICAVTDSVLLVDTDLSLFSGFMPDSVVVWVSQSPDIPSDQLYATPNAQVMVQGNGTQRLVIQGDTISTYFKDVLQSLRWKQNGTGVFGPRSIGITVYAGPRQSDTVYAFIELVQPPQAGRDTLLSGCIGQSPIALSQLLQSGIDPATGNWSSGLSQFNFNQIGLTDVLFVATHPVCPSDTALISFDVHPLPVLDLGSDTILCPGKSLTLTGAANAVNQWSTGLVASSILIPSAATYSVTATNSLVGCTNTDTILVAWAQADTTVMMVSRCLGQAYQFNGSTFFTDTVVCISSLVNQFGCDSTVCADLHFEMQELAFDTVVCEQTVLQVYGITWPLATGIYSDTVLWNGCQTRVVADIEYTTVLQTVHVDTICSGSQLLWNQQMLSQTGTYRDTLTSQAGCDSIALLALFVKPVPAFVILGNMSICPGVTDTLFIQSNEFIAAYEWSNGNGTANLLISTAGLYSVTITDAFGCSANGSVQVSQNPAVQIAFPVGYMNEIQQGTEAVWSYAHLQDSIISLQWQPTALFPCDTCLEVVILAQKDTTIQVVVYDINGCSQSIAIPLNVLELEVPEWLFYHPTIFKRTSTIQANHFYELIVNSGKIERIASFEIYDRWGSLVHRSTDGSAIWDGTYRGKTCEQGVFLVTARLKLLDGSELEITESLTFLH